MIRMVHPVRRPTGMMVLGCVLLVSAMPAARKSPADELRSEGPDAKTARLVDYNREVRPILSKNCFASMARTRRSESRGCDSTSAKWPSNHSRAARRPSCRATRRRAI